MVGTSERVQIFTAVEAIPGSMKFSYFFQTVVALPRFPSLESATYLGYLLLVRDNCVFLDYIQLLIVDTEVAVHGLFKGLITPFSIQVSDPSFHLAVAPFFSFWARLQCSLHPLLLWKILCLTNIEAPFSILLITHAQRQPRAFRGLDRGIL